MLGVGEPLVIRRIGGEVAVDEIGRDLIRPGAAPLRLSAQASKSSTVYQNVHGAMAADLDAVPESQLGPDPPHTGGAA